ncbi:NADPH-dependent FMN reductase [Pseudonocardia sp. EC080610-09]|jgi:MsuE subfamily FMN reductase|uniref:NADPH-dependent FMN reductase n=1 Tax=unclassified Pseudonocardia TaxID=2619320 RepID=UPI0006CB69C8|nr:MULTISPECIES: NADPH-dependent FMN reductase [unclassified Pseudonocardia]ALE72022.1 NADPH-dependent FMN reductase [Pseudonocardia sp. EC080625-04]ALL75296.1 NADPH-dependent FMN reductase [Pseudonocardia sp. EC080610-09]ALL82321.1 NADPH-dependent FMN reductase [Pseudonocardia sp. EC080619-01]
MDLLAISGSPSTPSKTALLLEIAVARAAGHDDVDAGLLHLRDHDVVFSDGRDPAGYTGDTRAVIDRVVAADALVVGTPMYRGGYTGRLKNLFDVLPNDALAGKPVGLVATGGTDHHFLAIEHELKPLVGFFRAWAAPGAVYANNTHFAGGELTDDGVRDRLAELADTVVTFARRMPRDAAGATGPDIPRRSLRDS